MKRREELASYRAASIAELVKNIRDAESELLRLRFDHALRKLKNISLIRRTRRRIATLKTIVREKVAASARDREAE